MSLYKTIVFVNILLFNIKQPVTSLYYTHAGLMKQLTSDMGIDCIVIGKTYFDNTCKIICLDPHKIFNSEYSGKNNFIYVKPHLYGWSYPVDILRFVRLTPRLLDFACVNPNEKFFCSFEELDHNVISVVGDFKGATEDSYVKIVCKDKSWIEMKVKCYSNQLRTDDRNMFDEAFYRNKCRKGCDKNSLNNIINKYPEMDHNCLKDEYNYYDYCSLYCTNKNSAFQIDNPKTSLTIYCKGAWVLYIKNELVEPLTEKVLDVYHCEQITDGKKLCSLDVIDKQIVIADENLTALVEEQRINIDCRHEKKSFHGVFCSSDGLLLNDENKELTRKYIVDYCEAICRREDLISALGDGVSLICDKEIYEVGEGCIAYCLEKETLFDIPHPSTNVKVLCKETWYFEWDEGDSIPVDTKDTEINFLCKTKSERYCSLEDLKQIVDFPLEYQGLGDNQELSVACKNSVWDPITISCDGQFPDLYSTLYFYCNDVCKKSILDNSILNLDNLEEYSYFDQQYSLKCRHNSILDPIIAYCGYDKNFRHVTTDEKITLEYSSTYCAGTCNVDKIKALFSLFKSDMVTANSKQTFNIPCEIESIDSVAAQESTTSHMQVYCNEDGEFYEVESNNILTHSISYEYCKLKCQKRVLQSYLDENFLTDCEDETAPHNECYLYCKDPKLTIVSNSKDKSNGKLVCQGSWKLYIRSNKLIELKKMTAKIKCVDGCKRSDLFDIASEDVTVSCPKEFIPNGEICHIYCKYANKVFGIGNRHTKIDVRCLGNEWNLQYSLETTVNLPTNQMNSKFHCLDVSIDAKYCPIEAFRALANFPPEYKAITEDQSLKVTCKNNPKKSDTISCMQFKSPDKEYEKVEQYCKLVCEKNILSGGIIRLENIDDSELNRKQILTCRNTEFLKPIKIYCNKDSFFHQIETNIKITDDFVKKYCEGACNTEKIRSVISHFEIESGNVPENKTFIIPCQEEISNRIYSDSSIPSHIQVYCNQDGEFYEIESNVVLTQSSFYEYCKVKCKRKILRKYLEWNVSTDCDREIAYGEECSVYCTDKDKMLISDINEIPRSKLVCEGVWKLKRESNTLFVIEKLHRILFCYDGCSKAQLVNVIGEDVTLNCKTQIYYPGQSCSAYCTNTETLFDIPDNTTRVDLQCYTGWHIKYKSIHLELNENPNYLRCRNIAKEEIYCSLDNMRYIERIPSEYKGLGKGQILEFTCNQLELLPYPLNCWCQLRNSDSIYHGTSNPTRMQLNCNDDGSFYETESKKIITQSSFYEECNGVCGIEKITLLFSHFEYDLATALINQTFDIPCQIDSIDSTSGVKFSISHMEVYCKEDGEFYSVKTNKILTHANLLEHCKGTCEVDKIKIVVSRFEHELFAAVTNQILNIPCPINSPDSHTKVYCNEDRQFYTVDTNKILTHSSLLETCKGKCEVQKIRSIVSQFEHDVVKALTYQTFVIPCRIDGIDSIPGKKLEISHMNVYCNEDGEFYIDNSNKILTYSSLLKYCQGACKVDEIRSSVPHFEHEISLAAETQTFDIPCNIGMTLTQTGKAVRKNVQVYCHEDGNFYDVESNTILSESSFIGFCKLCSINYIDRKIVYIWYDAVSRYYSNEIFVEESLSVYCTNRIQYGLKITCFENNSLRFEDNEEVTNLKLEEKCRNDHDAEYERGKP